MMAFALCRFASIRVALDADDRDLRRGVDKYPVPACVKNLLEICPHHCFVHGGFP